jgi:hypothetical protein
LNFPEFAVAVKKLTTMTRYYQKALCFSNEKEANSLRSDEIKFFNTTG